MIKNGEFFERVLDNREDFKKGNLFSKTVDDPSAINWGVARSDRFKEAVKKAIEDHGSVLLIHSYSTPIAAVFGDPRRAIVTSEKFSATTTSHCSSFSVGCAERNIPFERIEA